MALESDLDIIRTKAAAVANSFDHVCEYFWSGVKLHLLSHAATPKSELNKILSKAAAVANIFKHLFDYGTVELV